MHGEIHVTLCLTYLLNDKNFNTCFITLYFNKLSCSSHICYADFKLQRNKVQNRKLSFAVIENFDTELLYRYLMRRRALRRYVWFYRICILIKGSLGLGPWNVIVQNIEYQRGYSKIRLMNWLPRQPKS